MMNPDRNLLRYACVAHSPDSTAAATILAEYNPLGDESIHELAQKCLIRTPAYHSMFNHNIRGTSYTLLIHDSFVFFAVSDEVLPKWDRIRLLTRVKEALLHHLIWKRKNKNHEFTSYCFQSELGPLLESGGEDQDGGGEVDRNGYHEVVRQEDLGSGVGCRGRRMIGAVPLSLKKRMMMFEDTGENNREVRVDGDDHQISSTAAEGNKKEVVGGDVGLCSSDGKQKAKKMWRKHVWIVLFMDLTVCLILFGIWLMICHGFRCLDA